MVPLAYNFHTWNDKINLLTKYENVVRKVVLPIESILQNARQLEHARLSWRGSATLYIAGDKGFVDNALNTSRPTMKPSGVLSAEAVCASSCWSITCGWCSICRLFVPQRERDSRISEHGEAHRTFTRMVRGCSVTEHPSGKLWRFTKCLWPIGNGRNCLLTSCTLCMNSPANSRLWCA
jgi:hypothetical protein